MNAGAGLRGLVLRWLKFNAVGAIGILVQTASLAVLVSGLRLHYVPATAIAVELAVLHNFVWHERFTWKDRPSASRLGRVRRLMWFNLTTGGISLAGNVALMVLLAGVLGVNYLLANLATIAALSFANFAVSHTFVFRKQPPVSPPGRRGGAGTPAGTTRR